MPTHTCTGETLQTVLRGRWVLAWTPGTTGLFLGQADVMIRIIQAEGQPAFYLVGVTVVTSVLYGFKPGSLSIWN